MIFETTFLFWWCATLVKFGWEVAPPRFHFQSKSASHAEVTPPDFFFRTDFPFSRYRRGQWSRHIGPQKESHVFLAYKRQEHASKTRETCEKHARLSGGRLHSSGTLLPFSYGDEGITRAVVTKKGRSCRVCIQNEDVHIARNSYFKFNTPKPVISYWNESLVVPSFPLSSASSAFFPLR